MNDLLFDQSDRSKIEVRGADAVSFLHNLCSNDVNGLPVGQGCEAFLLTAQGRVLAWLRIYRLSDCLWLDADPGQSERIVAHLQRYAITEDVQFDDRTPEWGQYLVGPTLLAKQGLPTLDKDLQIIRTEWRGEVCVVRRNAALEAHDVLVAKSAKEALRMAWGVAPATDVEYEYYRIAAGIPVYGVDVTEANLAQEVNRDARALSFKKGCYLGQEPVVRIRDLGHVNKKLVRLRFEGDVAVAKDAKITRAGQDVGQVTSAARGQPTVALGYLRRGHWDVGTDVQVDGHPAKIA